MKYSVIVPACQAEKTISRCLDSLLAENRDDVEIILVNDGSTDGTEAICTSYAQRDDRIRYFWKPNGGVSSARNLGLSRARGDYVLFVDSDDYVTPDFFAVIDAHMTADCQFLMFGRYVQDGASIRACPLYDQAADNPEQTARLLSRALAEKSLNAVHAKVFRRQCIVDQGLRFDERLPIGEDKVFVVQYVVHADNLRFIQQPLYVLSIDNSESLSRRKRVDLCDHVLLEHRLLFDVIRNSVYRDALDSAVCYSYHRSAYSVVRELYKFEFSRHRRVEMIRDIFERYAAKKDCTYFNLNHWLLSLPVRMKMAGLTELALRKKK